MTVTKKKGGRPTKKPDVQTFARLYEQHTSKEIAEQYGVKESTVRGWAYHYRKET